MQLPESHNIEDRPGSPDDRAAALEQEYIPPQPAQLAEFLAPSDDLESDLFVQANAAGVPGGR